MEGFFFGGGSVSVLFLTDDSGSTCFRDLEHLRMAGVRVGAWVKSFYKKRIQNIQNYFFFCNPLFMQIKNIVRFNAGDTEPRAC